MAKLRAAIVGVGNCATSLIQGVEFYKDAKAKFGDEAWASYQGRAVAVGTYRSGELHPTRVFNT